MDEITTRHLTVMFTDIKNFTGRTSTQTREELLSLIKAHDELLRPIIERFKGTIVKTIGDAFLTSFESPTNAVLCAIEIQKTLKEHNEDADKKEHIQVRIGINSGEVSIKNDDLFGETVNIASRIESLAKAGQILFTQAIYLAMNKNEITFKKVGKKSLKGIPQKIQIYEVIEKKPNRFKALFKWMAILVIILFILNAIALATGTHIEISF